MKNNIREGTTSWERKFKSQSQNSKVNKFESQVPFNSTVESTLRAEPTDMKSP